ncbi:hypothetical protein LXA43DRAFT_1041324 [Ganoderma leucocontextum]|nr:hypothetical protein LXA43DRAFT_1041324 [Ganoderma leucocontextum]
MRPIISYDDITIPQLAEPPVPPERQTNPTAVQPPAKKRKTGPNHRQGGSGSGRAGQPMQHWDDPGNQGMSMSYDDAPKQVETKAVAAEEEYYEEEEESRELTREEIWDDSALIDAWNSAAAEYEAFHGPGKQWKQEPIKKSPLWYNVPLEKTSKGGSKASSSNANGTNVEEASNKTGPADSAPINFDTFVPTHDPSLAAAAGATSTLSVPAMDGILGSGAEAAMVSQDEAFSRAMTAMYWSGYWTAIYHCRRNESKATAGDETSPAGGEGDEIEGGDDDDDDMLPAQR